MESKQPRSVMRILAATATVCAVVVSCESRATPAPPPSAPASRSSARRAPVAPAMRAVPPPPAGRAFRSGPENATLEVLASGLASPDYATRLVATEALGCAPAAFALRPLEAQLGDPEADVRAASIGALHKHRHPTAAALLRSVRDDTEEELFLRVLAAAALTNPAPSCQ